MQVVIAFRAHLAQPGFQFARGQPRRSKPHLHSVVGRFRIRPPRPAVVRANRSSKIGLVLLMCSRTRRARQIGEPRQCSVRATHRHVSHARPGLLPSPATIISSSVNMRAVEEQPHRPGEAADSTGSVIVGARGRDDHAAAIRLQRVRHSSAQVPAAVAPPVLEIQRNLPGHRQQREPQARRHRLPAPAAPPPLAAPRTGSSTSKMRFCCKQVQQWARRIHREWLPLAQHQQSGERIDVTADQHDARNWANHAAPPSATALAYAISAVAGQATRRQQSIRFRCR